MELHGVGSGVRTGPGVGKARRPGPAPDVWAAEPWWSLDAYRRHLLQLELADRLLGELLAELRELELYERSLLIVTADHGASFWPETARRALAGHPHPEDILSVPLFVKRPGRSRGEIDRRTVELVDLLPAIWDLLGVEAPWPMDGCSLFDPHCPERVERSAFSAPHPQLRRLAELHFPAEIVFERATLRRKLDFFGSGARPGGLYRFGPHADLVGREVRDLAASAAAGSVALEHGAAREGERWRATSLRIIGELRLERALAGVPQVAVALDGRIATIVPAPGDGSVRHRLAALVPEESLASGSAELRLYAIDAADTGRRLAPLAIE